MTPTERIREAMETMVTNAEQTLANAQGMNDSQRVRKADGELKIARATRAQAEWVLSALSERGIDADYMLNAIMTIVQRLPTEGALANAWAILCAGQRAFADAVRAYDESEKS